MRLNLLRLLILLALLLPIRAPACVVFGAWGLLGINHEDVVIIWDSATSTEHFIRSVTLNSKARDAGFLVPTPSTPQLAVADSRIFNLANKYLPVTRGYKVLDILGMGGMAGAAAGAPRIISEQDIGDYHAVVLDASDTKGLGAWLKANGYPWSDPIAKWLDPYVTAKWKITAFKLRRAGGSANNIHTNAIRMSFKIDRPFFPYSEPAEASKLGGDYRVLNLAFLGDTGVVGKLAHGIRWPARVKYAGSSTPPASANFDKNDWLKYAGLAGTGLKLPPQLTYYSDTSNPRPGKSDLYFYPKPDPAHAR